MPFDGAGFAPIGYVEKIDKVIDLLGAPDRWGKGNFRTHDGRYCVRGALREVAGAEQLQPVILAAISEVTGRRYRRIESFNDDPQTAHEQVLAVLVRARDNLVAGRLPPARNYRMLSVWWRNMAQCLGL